MDHPQRKHPRLKDYDYSQNGCYFITICTIKRKKLFWAVGRDDLIPPKYALSSFGAVVKKHIEHISASYPDVFVDNYVIMPNHVHLLLRFDSVQSSDSAEESRRPTVMTVIRTLKTLTTRQVGFSLWQSSFYEHVIRCETDYQNIWNYIADNPRKWTEDTYYVK